jgi:hypothetical protein
VNDRASGKPVRSLIKIEVPPPQAVLDRAGADGADEGLPVIDRVPVEEIRVGAGSTLVVPHEDHGTDLDESSEPDLVGKRAQNIREPDGRFRGGPRFSAPRPGGTTETILISGYPEPGRR